MTVGEIRKAIEGLPDNATVMTKTAPGDLDVGLIRCYPLHGTLWIDATIYDDEDDDEDDESQDFDDDDDDDDDADEP